MGYIDSVILRDRDMTDASGAVTTFDKADLSGSKITLGRGLMSDSGTFNRRGYTGYDNDGVLGDGANLKTNTRFWHVRSRVLDSILGRWTTRDPAGYVDDHSLYNYAEVNSIDTEAPFASVVGRATTHNGYLAGPLPGTAWPIGPLPNPLCWLAYRGAVTLCNLQCPPSSIANTYCVDAANFTHQACRAASTLPVDLPALVPCLAAVPVGPTAAFCSLYWPCGSHYGVNFRCMCY